MTNELQKPPAATVGELRAVGPPPNADILLVGALLYGSPPATASLLKLVHDDDVESNALAAILGTIRRLTASGKPCGPSIVFDELQRVGKIRNHSGVTDALQAAVTSGGPTISRAAIRRRSRRPLVAASV